MLTPTSMSCIQSICKGRKEGLRPLPSLTATLLTGHTILGRTKYKEKGGKLARAPTEPQLKLVTIQNETNLHVDLNVVPCWWHVVLLSSLPLHEKGEERKNHIPPNK